MAFREFTTYVGRVREFNRTDWIVYVSWVGLIFGLALSSGGFLLVGRIGAGVRFPPEAWLLPAGALVFGLAIAVDTIGHRTIYKPAIREAEGLVHGITIFSGIGSCVLLTAAYRAPRSLWVPALVLTVLSFVYSLVDEAFHWRRYVQKNSDRVEIWSHVGILVGHGTMMVGWWAWFWNGYPGVYETLEWLHPV